MIQPIAKLIPQKYIKIRPLTCTKNSNTTCNHHGHNRAFADSLMNMAPRDVQISEIESEKEIDYSEDESSWSTSEESEFDDTSDSEEVEEEDQQIIQLQNEGSATTLSSTSTDSANPIQSIEESSSTTVVPIANATERPEPPLPNEAEQPENPEIQNKKPEKPNYSVTLPNTYRVFPFFSNFVPIINVGYKGEKGYGEGVERSFFKTFGDSIRESDYFWRPNDNYYSPRADKPKQNLDIFMAVGWGLGYCLHHNTEACRSETKSIDILAHSINVRFTRSFYKQILNRPVNFHDLAFYDHEMYDNMLKFRQISAEDLKSMEQTFTYTFKSEETTDGLQRDVPLKDNGENILVTSENIDEFIELCVYKKIVEPYEKIAALVRKGICLFYNKTLDYPIDSLLDNWKAEDLCLVLGGEEKFNRDYFLELVTNAVMAASARRNHYVNDCFTTKIGPNFITCVNNLNNEELFKLWFFWTSLPILTKNFDQSLKIDCRRCNDNCDPEEQDTIDKSFFSAATCGYELCLQPFSSCEVMMRQLLYSINCVDFGTY